MKPAKKEANALTASDFQTTATDERRSEPRFNCNKTISILPCTPDKDWHFQSAQLIDCSAHGLAVRTNFPIKAGDQFLAKLKLDRIILALYTVRHCRDLENNQYQLGAQLSGFIGTPDSPEAVLQSLTNSQSE